jgi:DNA-binding transcriptional MocR family regulator
MNAKVAFPPETITKTMGEIIESQGMTQLRIAETEKYAHVTFFFNGGVEEPYKGEDRILVPSPKVATYDLQPEMSAIEVTDKVVEAIKSGKYDFIILEDDPYGELRFAGENVPTIKSLDTEGRVIYSSTFSKIISSGFRTGFVSAPAPIIQKMIVCKQVSDVHSNIWAQVVSHRFMTTVDREAHFSKLRDIYRKKCDLMCSYIENGFSKDISYIKPQGGLFIWCTLPDNCDMNAFCTKAVQEYKIAVVPGNSFNIKEDEVSHSFRLNYSTPTNEQIKKGMEILARMTREMLD